jgi:hypothetical protein
MCVDLTSKKEVGLEDEVSENELKFILNFSSGI